MKERSMLVEKTTHHGVGSFSALEKENTSSLVTVMMRQARARQIGRQKRGASLILPFLGVEVRKKNTGRQVSNSQGVKWVVSPVLKGDGPSIKSNGNILGYDPILALDQPMIHPYWDSSKAICETQKGYVGYFSEREINGVMGCPLSLKKGNSEAQRGG
ncbi:hypothetical protein QYF36_010565 [Acer negundo]|nr:hypothetical protein QYF36_010565 [Acer negundo]